MFREGRFLQAKTQILSSKTPPSPSRYIGVGPEPGRSRGSFTSGKLRATFWEECVKFRKRANLSFDQQHNVKRESVQRNMLGSC